MKVRSLLLLAVGLVVWGTRALPTAAQFQRSPREVEVRELTNDFYRQVQNLQVGGRIFARINNLAALVRSGLPLELGIATFLGESQGWKSQPVSSLPKPPPKTVLPASSGGGIGFEVCSESPSWVRPPSGEQTKKLQSTGRYADAQTNKEIQDLVKQFWHRNVIAFTSYGLSARVDPIYLSGLWAIPNTMDSISNKCYVSKERITQLNSGKTAEVWLLLHKVKSVKWLNNRYVMVVQPVQKGAQFVQFTRVEKQPALPLKVMTEDGKELEVIHWG